MDVWMKLKPFCKKYGIPILVMRNALRGPYKNQIGRRITPGNTNSDWLIDVETALKLFKERAI